MFSFCSTATKTTFNLLNLTICVGKYNCFHCRTTKSIFNNDRGLSGGAKVLDKLLVPMHPTNLDKSRARAYCACSWCGWGLFGHFFSRLSLLISFSLSGRWPDID